MLFKQEWNIYKFTMYMAISHYDRGCGWLVPGETQHA